MNATLHVAKKELRDMFRDKRVRSSVFFGPFFLMVMISYLVGSVIGSLGKPENQKVHVIGLDSPLIADLKKEKFNVIEVPSVAAGEKLIREGNARIVLQMPEKIEPGKQQVINAYFDPKQQIANITLSIVSAKFSEANKAALKSVLRDRGIPEVAMEPIRIEKKEVQVGAKGGAGDFIVGMLPYLIVIWAFFGGISIVSDLVAGEKEKNTLETLLITPVRRTQIVFGKFLALAVICLLSSLSSVVGIMAVSALHLPGSDTMFKGGSGITPTSFAVILTVLIPTVAFFASILIAISTYAKNPREAQSYLNLVNFLVLTPAVASQFIGLTDAANAMWVNFMPVLNTANNIRTALLGRPDFVGVGVTVVISAILAIIALRVAVWLFNREEVLTRV